MMLPKADDSCPSCTADLSKAPEYLPEAAAQAQQERETRAKPSGFAGWIRGKSVIMIGIGVILAVMGMFGCSYQRRGAGYTASGSELTSIGIGLAVIGAVLYGISILTDKNRR